MRIRDLWQKRKSIVFTWLLSYSAVLFVPLIISLVIYAQSSHALRGEIHRANDSLLKQARYSIDKQIDLMKRLNTEITWNAKLQSLMYATLTPGDKQYAAYQLANDLLTYQTSYASIDEFYVVWERESSVLRPGNVRDLEIAFNTLHETGDMSYGQWMDKIHGDKNNRFLLLPRLASASPRTTMAYVTQMPKDLNGEETGVVVVMADIDRFQEAIESISGFSGGQMLILSRDNEVLMSTLPVSVDEDRVIDRLSEPGQEALLPAQVGDMELFAIPSAVSDLKYALLIPSSVYWEKAEYLRRFAYTSILVSLIGAGVLTLYFMRRNYSPIQQLVRSLSEHAGHHDRAEGGNELNFIERAISQTRSEKDKIALQLQIHQHTLRSNMLNRLFKGKADSPVPYPEAFRSFDMKLLSDRFAVILFVVENDEGLSSAMSASQAGEGRKLVQFIITNIAEELAGRYGHVGYVAEVDEMMVGLINFADEEGRHDRHKDDLYAIATEVQRFSLRFRLELTVSIGGIHETLAGVAEAYREAVDAMAYKMVRGKREIITYDEIRVDAGDHLGFGYYYPLQLEQQIINAIKAGECEQASRSMGEVMQRNFDKPIMPLTLARCLIFNLVGTMVKAINELGDGEHSVLGDNPLWMDKIIACDTIQEMQAELFALLEEVCAFAAAKRDRNVSQERAESLRDLAANVVRHIEEHYDDPNLNVNTIGERFQLKGSYLSKLFKSQTGEGLPDYLNKFRIERAKGMIGERRLSVGDIAKQVGYHEVATFIRVFKKYEGITPGKFKEMV